MFCAKCGVSVLEGSQFCVNCGNPVADSVTASTSTPAPTPMSADVGRYAGFWRRVAASMLDSLVLIGVLLVAIIAMTVAGIAEDTVAQVYALTSWIGGWLYYALMHSSSRQATLGKRALGIKVTNLEGGRIGFGRATGRYFATILSSLTLGVGFVMAGFTRKRQALHDMVANTLVVSKDASPAAIQAGLEAPRAPGGIIAIAVIASLVPVTGILAAIAIPAYQDYQIRSQVTSGLMAAAPYKATVVAAHASGRAFADMQSETMEVSDAAGSPYVSSISISDGVVVVEFGSDANQHIAGTQLLLVPGSIAGEGEGEGEGVVWICGLAPVPDGVTPAIDSHAQYTNLEPKYLPSSCRGK